MTTDSWYALYVIPGDESCVARTVSKIDGVTDTCVPIEHLLYRQGGVWQRRERLMLPSYVLIQVEELTASIYHKIMGIGSVLRLLGKTDAEMPKPIPAQQIEVIRQMTVDGASHPMTLTWSKRDGAVVLESTIPEGVDVIKIDTRQHRVTATIRLGELEARVHYPLIPSSLSKLPIE